MAPAMTLNGHAMHPKYSRTPLKSSRPLTGPCPAILAAAAEVGTRPVHDEPAAREAAMAPAGTSVEDKAALTGPALRSITTKLGTCKFPKSGEGVCDPHPP
ncbi:hypothetical protein WJX77_012678 [Trebouxia sp. C0004]